MLGKIKLKLDAVIFGGGVSGLWTLNILKKAGYQVILLESNSLGYDQTITCQGILHGGIKYSLAGKLTKSAINIRDMPGIWQKHILGHSYPDLSNVQVRADFCYLWGQKMWLIGSVIGLSVTPRKISNTQKPSILASYKGDLYALGEQIISPASLLRELSAEHKNSELQISMDHIEFRNAENGDIKEIILVNPENGRELVIETKTVILTAGSGNELLRKRMGFREGKMQRRPLHMVVVKGKSLPFFNGHYIEKAQPGVTVTSAESSDGSVVWLLGGQLAEKSLDWSSDKLVEASQKSLNKIFPDVGFKNLKWATFKVNRAEVDTKHCKKPDDVFVDSENNVITAWPTKMVLAPRLAERILEKVDKPSTQSEADLQELENWPRPQVAMEPWENAEWFDAY
ncbi:MAG: FAD-dependent oxidoreductase [bacterium]